MQLPCFNRFNFNPFDLIGLFELFIFTNHIGFDLSGQINFDLKYKLVMKGKYMFQLILFLVFNPLGNIAYPNPNNLR